MTKPTTRITYPVQYLSAYTPKDGYWHTHSEHSYPDLALKDYRFLKSVNENARLLRRVTTDTVIHGDGEPEPETQPQPIEDTNES